MPSWPPPGPEGFDLPETYFYLNMDGLSYQVTTAYRLNKNTRFPVAVEHIFKGKRKTEYSFGMEKRWADKITTHLKVIKGVKWEFYQKYSYHWTKSLALSFGWARYAGENLFGARHIPSIADPSLIDDEFFGAVTYQF